MCSPNLDICHFGWGKWAHARGRVYQSCVRSAMLHAIETWTPTISDMHPRNATTELWPAGCTVSPPRTKSARKLSWGGCSLAIWKKYCAPAHSDGTVVQNVAMVGWRKSFPQKITSTGGCVRCRPEKAWTKIIGTYCLVLGLTETHSSERKARSGRFKSAVKLDPTLETN